MATALWEGLKLNSFRTRPGATNCQDAPSLWEIPEQRHYAMGHDMMLKP